MIGAPQSDFEFEDSFLDLEIDIESVVERAFIGHEMSIFDAFDGGGGRCIRDR